MPILHWTTFDDHKIDALMFNDCCSRDTVKISMDTFIKRFQPDIYEKWRLGEDHGPHPEDLNRPSPVK